MKIKIHQLNEEVIEKNVKMQLHHQLVNRHQESPSANKISVGSQTIKVSITGYVRTYVLFVKFISTFIHHFLCICMILITVFPTLYFPLNAFTVNSSNSIYVL